MNWRRRIIRVPLLASLVCAMPAPALAAERADAPAPLAPVNLRIEYHPICRRTCEYIGFSFGGPPAELAEMRAAGANSVGLGAMWIPVPDPDAPYGCGTGTYGGYGTLEQLFRVEEPFDAFTPALPTGFSTDSGCDWELISKGAAQQEEKSIARGSWRNVADNSRPEAAFPVQSQGTYGFRISNATGSWIGWWGRTDDPYPDGHAVLAGDPNPAADLEFRLRTGGEWTAVVGPGPDRTAFPLGPSPLAPVRSLGLAANFSVGNWNNPGFPYYPDWFRERFPEAAAVDQNGDVITGGMFGALVPAPGIEHPAIVNGTSRYIRRVAAGLRHSPALAYWVMGGEAMYATYSYPDRWTDYSPNALRHFRRWLARRRYRAIDELNAAWASRFEDFDAVEPPRAPAVSRPWLDWLDFRFESMGERFAWHYRAIRSADPARLVLSCNHGSLYHGLSYARMGARPEIYAAVSDGFETGQIITDSDPDLYNLLYTESLSGLGKPYAPVRLAYKKSDPRARGGGTSYSPEAARRYVYESLGAGAWHLGLIQWSGSLPDGEWGVRGTPAEAEIAALFSEIRSLWPLLDDTFALRPALGVFLSHPTWALQGFLPEWQQFHTAAVRRQVPKNYVYDGQLLSGELARLPCILSVSNHILGPGIPEALLEYASAGGRLIVSGPLGDGPANLTAPLPPELGCRKSAPIGSGRITFLETADPAVIIAALLDEKGGNPEVRPVQITSRTKVLRPAESLIAVEHTDWPQDLTSATSLGQTVRVDREGLRRIAIRTPTYLKVPPAGFRLTVRSEGPGGSVLAARDVPAGIADNSWIDIPLPEPVPVGALLYVEAVPDPALPPEHLGWWSTRDDPYPGGQAFVDGEPVPGDRHVRLECDEPVPGEMAIESFVLTDGLNFGVVLINTAAEDTVAEVDLAALPFPLPADGYSVRCPLDPSAWTGDGLSSALRLPAAGTRFLWVERETAEAEAAAALAEARRAVAAWESRGAVTPFAARALERAAACAAEKRFAKSLALALKTASALGLAVEPVGPPAAPPRELRIRVFDRRGLPLTAGEVAVALTPAPFSSRRLSPDPDGGCRLNLDPASLPPVYDYEKGDYVPCRGPLRIRVSARSGPLSASRLLDLDMPPPAPEE